MFDGAFRYEEKGVKYVKQHLSNKLSHLKKEKLQEILDSVVESVSLVNKDRPSFPSGLLHQAQQLMNERGFNYEVIDHIEHPEPEYKWKFPKGFEPRDYQQNCLGVTGVVLHSHHMMLARMATGAGKTFDACMTIAEYGLPTIYIVPSSLLLEQAYEDFCYFFGKDNIGRLGAGYAEDAPIQIATIQTVTTMLPESNKKSSNKNGKVKAKKRSSTKTGRMGGSISTEICGQGKAITVRCSNEDRAMERAIYFARARLIIIDEVHRIPADLYYSSVTTLFPNVCYTKSYTATDRRIDGKSIKIFAAGGDNHFTILPAQLINEGYLTPPMIYFNAVELREFPNFIKADDETKFFKQYNAFIRYQITENDEYNEKVAMLALNATMKNKHVLIAINKIEHGENIQKFINSDEAELVHSSTPNAWDKIKAFRAGEYPILISTLCSEGFNAPCIDNLIIAYDSTDTEQVVGRGLRLNDDKETCRIDHMFHYVPAGKKFRQAKYLLNHAYECQKLYKELAFPILKDINGA
jgi:superfamily II DNA or RNA helicase